VRLDECRYLVTGGPNDEAFLNHRFATFGLEHYRIQEVVDSPWIREVLTLLHKERKYTGPDGYRHFIFGLKECTVDCIAKTIACIGLYPDHPAAMAAAFADSIDGFDSRPCLHGHASKP
jgi:hypothetical protein